MNEELVYISKTIGHLLGIKEEEIDEVREDLKKEYNYIIEKGKVDIDKKDGKTLDVTLEIDGDKKRLRKKIIHGRKLEPIYGADVAIEFPGERIIFIQWKKVNSKGRFDIRRDQLLTLLKLCRMLCGCKYYRCCWKYPLFCPPIKCGATYYALIFSDEEVRYIRS